MGEEGKQKRYLTFAGQACRGNTEAWIQGRNRISNASQTAVSLGADIQLLSGETEAGIEVTLPGSQLDLNPVECVSIPSAQCTVGFSERDRLIWVGLWERRAISGAVLLPLSLYGVPKAGPRVTSVESPRPEYCCQNETVLKKLGSGSVPAGATLGAFIVPQRAHFCSQHHGGAQLAIST